MIIVGVPTQIVAMIRRCTARFLTQTCTVERQKATPTDALGDRSHIWEIVAQNVPCRLIMAGQRTGSAVVERAMQEQMRDEYRLIVARTVALDVDMRVTVAGVTFDVVRIDTALTDEAFHSAILNRRV